MKAESIEKIKMIMVETYRKIGNKKSWVKGKRLYSGNEIANEIETATRFGIELVGNVIQLTIN